MHTRHRTVLLCCALGALLAAVAVCAGAAAPARAATALPARGIWSSVTGSPAATERWTDVAQGPGGSLYAGGVVASGTASSTSDLLVARFSGNDKAAGHLLWSDTWDSPAHLADQVTAIAVDAKGALVAVGTTQSAGSGREWVVAKWSPGGARLWQQTFAAGAGKRWSAEATDVVCDAAGALYVCGTAQTGTHHGHAASSLVVRKLRGSDGHLLWAHAYAGPTHSANAAVRLVLDRSGNVFCTGRGTGPRGDNDIVTVRLAAASGRQVWVRRIGDARHRDDQGVDLAARSGGLWVTGYEATGTGNQVVALARYTPSGRLLWLRTWLELPRTIEHPHALAVDAHGDAVVVGAGNDVPLTREHAFVLHYNAAGRLTWSRTAYGSVSGRAIWQDVAADGAGRIWTAGSSVAGSTRFLIVARYSSAGVNAWTSSWTGPAGLGAAGNALCFAGSAVFVGGTVTMPPLAGLDALGVKLAK